jgi:5-formyltetrahydrofolate cyclo-ligase
MRHWLVMNKLNSQAQSKANNRKIIAEKIALMTLTQKNLATEKVTSLFCAHPLFQTSQHIACYLAQANEIDSTHLIHTLWQAKKNCLLPVLTQNKELKFASYNPGDELKLNRYQILEPAHTTFFSAERLDLVIVPLVSFDTQGNRLGKGGGYYDKTFSFRLTSTDKKPFLLGLAYQAQELHQLPTDSWDVKLDGVLTETGLRVF